MKTALVCGAGGFIGYHLVNRLKNEGYWVRGVDTKYPQFGDSEANEFVRGDLRAHAFCRAIVDQQYTEVYQLAAEMGGANYIFTGENDAEIMHNSAMINLNMLEVCHGKRISKIFYSSSVCIYPTVGETQICSEESAYPANPDSEYGWEKIFSERLYLAYRRNRGILTHIARFQNTFGTHSAWTGGREKAPAAICRKIAMAQDGEDIEIWGNGQQRRAFVYVDDTVEGIRRLMQSDFPGPVNIGTEEIITIDQMVDMVAEIAGKQIGKKHVLGPIGVQGRGSDNRLIREKLNWEPTGKIRAGLEKTYPWIEAQVKNSLEKYVGE
jgi:GDP-D-mannose 3',5'-epimerase